MGFLTSYVPAPVSCSTAYPDVSFPHHPTHDLKRYRLPLTA
jgi:hypothetical protein